MWTSENILTEVSNCPVCGGTERIELRDKEADTSTYIEELLACHGLSTSAVIPRMRQMACPSCRTVWFDPWFNPDFVATGYGYLVGRHIHGWAALGSWAARKPRSYFKIHDRLLKLLEIIRPNLASYGELNCPFSGLAFALAERRRPNENPNAVVHEAIDAMARAYASTELKRNYVPVSRWHRLITKASRKPLCGPQTFLLTHESPYCWGSSCTFAGANCRSLSHGLFFDFVRDLRTQAAAGERLDALGIYNLLDHFSKPVCVLEQACQISDIVILEMSRLDHLDHQHPYNVGTEFKAAIRHLNRATMDVTPIILAKLPEKEDPRRYVLLISKGIADQVTATLTDHIRSTTSAP